MNKQTRYYIVVALVVLSGLGLALWSYAYLSSAFHPQYQLTALFTDAHGVTPGSFVQMAGVNIGQVKEVDLAENGHEAELKLQITGKYKVPIKSRFFIKVGILGNQGTLTVTPSSETVYYKNNDIIRGDSTDPIGDLINKAPGAMDRTLADLHTTLQKSQQTFAEVNVTLRKSQKLIEKFGRVTDSVNGQLGDPNSDLRQTLANVRATTAKLPEITSQLQSELATISVQTNQLLAGIQGTERKADKVIEGAGKLSDNLNGALGENRATIRSLLRNADDAASAVAGLTGQLKDTLADPKTRGNLDTITGNLASITTKLDTAASGLERLTADPRLSSDIRETVSNLRDTSASVKGITSRIEGLRLPGEKRRANPGEPSAPSPPARPKPLSFISLYEPGLVVDSSYDTTLERLRLDTNYTLLTGSNHGFYRLGLFDATEGNRLNFQAGRGLGGNATYRYGIVAGKLGGGFDFGAGPLAFRFDLFDPNRFTINARMRAYVNPDTAITAGVDSVGKDNRATVGITLRK